MINNLTMVARLVNDPVERRTSTGVMTVSGRVACQRSYKNKDGNYETDFFNYVIFGDKGTFFQKAYKKGMKATFSGRIEMRSYKDKDGNGKWYPEIVIENFEFPELGKEKQIKTNAEMDERIEQTEQEPESELHDNTFQELTNDGELPF